MDEASPPSQAPTAEAEAPPPVPEVASTGPSPPRAWIERESQRLPADPELDAALSETSLPFEPAPQESLRLVANPFLAVCALLLWIALMQLILSGAAGPFTFLAVLLALASLALLPRLLHYHCLDCGRTGALLSWKRHFCPSVVARRFEGRTRRLRGPAPIAQLFLWLWLYAQLTWIWYQFGRGR